MATIRTIEFDTLILEGDIYNLIEHCRIVSQHIYDNVPNEILLLPSGEPNVRTHWGAVYFHINMAKASLKAFV